MISQSLSKTEISFNNVKIPSYQSTTKSLKMKEKKEYTN